MAILKYIICILSAAFLAACTEYFDPGVDTEPVLCINSLITVGEPIDVKVTHSWKFTAGNSGQFTDKEPGKAHEVADAEVTVYANDKVVGTDYLPVEGDNIRIVAVSPTYGTAVAEVAVPYSTPIGKVSFKPVITSLSKYDGVGFGDRIYLDVKFNLNIEMEINDPAGTDNYYHFGYDSFLGPTADDTDGIWGSSHRDVFSIGSLEYDYEPIFKEHISVFETVMGNDEYNEFSFFTDRRFPGGSYTLNLNFSRNLYDATVVKDDESLLECGVRLYLTTVSKSYYNWAVYIWNTYEGVLGDLSDIGMAESQWGYSNVSTGAGVVAAQSTCEYTLSLKEFLKEIINQ